MPVEFDPYSDVFRVDPYPTYAKLQQEAPVYRNAKLGFWAISRYRDVTAALRDPTRFSSINGPLLDPAMWGPGAHKVLSFSAMDAPRHTVMRALAAPVFGPAKVATLEPEITRITRSHLAPALERGSFDFVTDLAAKVPMDVISELLGVPPGERERTRELANLAADRPLGSRDVPPEGAAALMELVEYLRGLIDERQRRPREDLTSALIAARIEGRPLTEEEVTACLVLLIAAGNETTTRLLAAAWYWAWRNPDQRAVAFSHRTDDWISETLRYDGPVQYVLRTTTQEMEVADTAMPQGARVMLLLAAANRDPDAFTAPDRYDLTRDTRRAIAFGLGPHFCLGAPLARLEARVVLGELAAQVRDYDIDAGRAQPVFTTNTRGFSSLPTTVKLR
ncbi:cytochrome P450 [Actinomadura darangshiensis]|uniref:Cytochrome P450 n=1 Tax=Actinomadura darangshiensis TaxID=705336 RepID=A0A4R5A7R5_9ACTN|nr:cytochrome P450 [Actinomadura darangshiensis]TDD67150.1 cytochrome P450 [Actinomadura darangshiensis]